MSASLHRHIHRWRYVIATLATAHVALITITVLLPFTPLPRSAGLIKSKFTGYLNALFLNHSYNFYAPQPGITQALNVQLTNGTTKREFWLQDRTRYDNDLSYARHQRLAQIFMGSPSQSIAVAKSLSRYICEREQADSVRLTWALHPELPRALGAQGLNHNDARFFVNPVNVGYWPCPRKGRHG